MLLKFKLDKDGFTFTNPADLIAAESIDYIKCHFDITDTVWKETDAIIAVFKSATYNKHSEVLLDSYNNCYIDPEVYKRGGRIQVKLVGDKYLNDTVISSTTITSVLEFNINENIIVPLESPSKYSIAIAELENVKSSVDEALTDLAYKLAHGELNGVGIERIVYNLDGTVTITLSDGTVFTSEYSMKGATGNSGVYYGPDEPTDPDIFVWVNPDGEPTFDPLYEIIDTWMQAHPEATTTVQDGSLTEAKFSAALKLKAIKDYVTPEMFGAVGDGLTDDTQAIQDAIDSGKPVLMVNKYLIESTITIANNNTILYCTGEIVFDNDIVIFGIKSSHNNIYVHKATGSHSSVSDHVYSFYGTLFKLNADKVEIGYNNIIVDDAENVKIAFDCYANGDSEHVYTGILYNKIAFTYIKAEYGIKFSCGSGGLPYINENQFFGGRLSGNYGVYAEKGSTQTDPYNGNKFINIGFEDIVCGISVEFFQFNSFRGVRVSESLHGSYWIVFASDCYCNTIQGDAGLSYTKIDDQNSSGFPNVYEFERMLFEWGNRDKYPIVGFGGKIFKNGSGWSAEYTAAAYRDYEIVGDGEQHDVPPVGLMSGWWLRIKRTNGIAIVNIPNNSGYGYRGAETIYFRVEAGNYSFVVRQNGSNINKAALFADQSGYYKLQYIDNREWIFYKLSDL